MVQSIRPERLWGFTVPQGGIVEITKCPAHPDTRLAISTQPPGCIWYGISISRKEAAKVHAALGKWLEEDTDG